MDRTPGITVTLMRSRCSVDCLPHELKDFFQASLPHLVRDGGQTKGVAQDAGIGAAVHGHSIDGEGMPHHCLHAGGEGTRVHAAMGVQQGPVNIEEIGVAVIPAKSLLDGYEALSRRCGQAGRLFPALSAHRLFGGVKDRTLAAGRALESTANLFRIELEFRDGAAERVAVHAQLPSCLALVSPVMRQHFENEAPFKLAHCLVVMNAAGVHLRHKTIQFTFHKNLFPFPTRSTAGFVFVSHSLEPWARIGCIAVAK